MAGNQYGISAEIGRAYAKFRDAPRVVQISLRRLGDVPVYIIPQGISGSDIEPIKEIRTGRKNHYPPY